MQTQWNSLNKLVLIRFILEDYKTKQNKTPSKWNTCVKAAEEDDSFISPSKQTK